MFVNRLDGQMALANTLPEAAGVTREPPDTEGGAIVRTLPASLAS